MKYYSHTGGDVCVVCWNGLELRDLGVTLINPTESVAENDWEAANATHFKFNVETLADLVNRIKAWDEKWILDKKSWKASIEKRVILQERIEDLEQKLKVMNDTLVGYAPNVEWENKIEERLSRLEENFGKVEKTTKEECVLSPCACGVDHGVGKHGKPLICLEDSRHWDKEEVSSCPFCGGKGLQNSTRTSDVWCAKCKWSAPLELWEQLCDAMVKRDREVVDRVLDTLYPPSDPITLPRSVVEDCQAVVEDVIQDKHRQGSYDQKELGGLLAALKRVK